MAEYMEVWDLEANCGFVMSEFKITTSHEWNAAIINTPEWFLQDTMGENHRWSGHTAMEKKKNKKQNCPPLYPYHEHIILCKIM